MMSCKIVHTSSAHKQRHAYVKQFISWSMHHTKHCLKNDIIFAAPKAPSLLNAANIPSTEMASMTDCRSACSNPVLPYMRWLTGAHPCVRNPLSSQCQLKSMASSIAQAMFCLPCVRYLQHLPCVRYLHKISTAGGWVCQLAAQPVTSPKKGRRLQKSTCT